MRKCSSHGSYEGENCPGCVRDAAPKLLKACKFAMTTYDGGLSDLNRKLFPESAKEYDLLKDAIAAAEE